jgi:hypothetical protein
MMAEWRDVGRVLLARWPSQVTSWGQEGIVAFVQEIKETANSDPDAIIKALRASTSAFPPSAGELTALVERQRQGPAPSFMEAMKLICRHISLLDYYEPATTFDKFIERLAEHHEAVARYALGIGPQQIKRLPDPAYAQDVGGSATLTRMDKSYAMARREWEEDPRPLAVAEARRQALQAVERGELHKLRVVGAIERGEGTDDAA